MQPIDVERMLKALTIKDLRIQCRARNLTPAGSLETLRDRVKDHMLATNDFAMKNEDGSDVAPQLDTAGVTSQDVAGGKFQNNYNRPSGCQNVGNFLTDKPTSRVLAPPGGGSSITFGDYQDPVVAKHNAALAARNEANGHTVGGPGNNYSRPNGQNVGNFLSDKPSSRVLAQPGGGSQIHFG